MATFNFSSDGITVNLYESGGASVSLHATGAEASVGVHEYPPTEDRDREFFTIDVEREPSAKSRGVLFLSREGLSDLHAKIGEALGLPKPNAGLVEAAAEALALEEAEA